MRKHITFFTLLFSLLTVLGQAIKISGKVDNFSKKKIVLKGNNFKKNIRFDKESKTFSAELTGVSEGHYTLHFKRRFISLYLTKGCKVNLEFDYKNRENTPKFTGTNANVNDYLAKKHEKYAHILGNAKVLFVKNEPDFLNKMDEYTKALKTLSTKKSLSKKYLAYENRNISYEYARNLNNYQDYHRILTGNLKFNNSSSFPNILTGISFNNAEDYKMSLNYRMLLKNYLEKKASKNKKEGENFDLLFMDLVNEKVSNKLIKDDLIFNVAEEGIVDAPNIKAYYDKFTKYTSNSTNAKKITVLYNQLKKVSKGKQSPTFNNYLNFDGGKSSLSDLTGNKKYICIYFWATWCSYCKKEMKTINIIKDKINTEKVQFVGINVDNAKNLEKWKRNVTEKNMYGLQLFSGESHMKLDFARKYLVKGVPRFILLDSNGVIVSSNMPRPRRDTTKFTELFLKHKLLK